MSWTFIKTGSPYGSTTVQDENGKDQIVVLNRATRRRYDAMNSTHKERLAYQEERRDHIRSIVRGTGPLTKQQEGHNAQRRRSSPRKPDDHRTKY